MQSTHGREAEIELAEAGSPAGATGSAPVRQSGEPVAFRPGKRWAG